MFGASLTGLLTDSCFDIFFIQLRPGKMSSLQWAGLPTSLKTTPQGYIHKQHDKDNGSTNEPCFPFFPGHSRLAELTVLR